MKRLLLATALPLVLAACGGASETAPAPHFPEDDAPVRTVVVGESGKPDDGGPIYATLLEGAPPETAGDATVLTDTDCEPDFAGISHCKNLLRLADGREILVRHDHAMAEYPCLSPGEVVRVVPA